VKANAAGLSVGSYLSSLTISGEGISQTFLVNLDLEVTTATYTLAVTLKQAVPAKGGGTVTSTSPDTSLNCTNIGASDDVTCQANFTINSTVTLAQARCSDSQYATWGAPGCGKDPTCQIALTSSQGTTVTFPYSYWAKDIISGATSDSLVTAYGSAAATDTINLRAVTFTEGAAGSTILFNSSKIITLTGGLDADYAIIQAFTSIKNVLKIGGAGSRVIIKGGGIKLVK
jgi:hypothetical protein